LLLPRKEQLADFSDTEIRASRLRFLSFQREVTRVDSRVSPHALLDSLFNWRLRLRVAFDIARGMCYHHQDCGLWFGPETRQPVSSEVRLMPLLYLGLRAPPSVLDVRHSLRRLLAADSSSSSWSVVSSSDRSMVLRFSGSGRRSRKVARIQRRCFSSISSPQFDCFHCVLSRFAS